jgi:hypothetical protein
MIKNIGTRDRLFRLILGIICFIGAYFLKNNTFQIALVFIGLFCIFQATFSWCAWYALIGKNTCPIQK